MSRRSKPHSRPSALAEEVIRLINDFQSELENDDLRAKVRKLIPAFHSLRDLGSSLLSVQGGGDDANESARARILAYFRKYPRSVIDGDELMVISGIGEWARRVRELRVQFGWWIYSGVTFAQIVEDLKEEGIEAPQEDGLDIGKIRPDQYILMREEEDRDAAYRWNVLNGLRKEPGGVKNKIIAYLRQNVGNAVSGEELRYLARDKKEWARRVRELRTEDGWPIATKQSGRPDLAVGVYILERDHQAAPHDRRIPDDVRVAVLQRDHFECTDCHWTRDMLSPDDPRKLLELHHKKFHRHKGDNTEENLLTLCNVCHDKLHRLSKT